MENSVCHVSSARDRRGRRASAHARVLPVSRRSSVTVAARGRACYRPISRTKGRSRYMAASGRADAGPRHVRKKSFTSRVKRRTIRPRVPSAFALRWFPFCSGKASRIPVLTQPGNYTPHFPKDFLLTRPADREKRHVHQPGDQVKT